MKLFLIKIGKVWGVLQREGIIAGGRRILGAFFALFQRVRPGDVLFVTNGVGDSARYRCRHVAEELNRQGFRTAITVQDNPFLPSYAEKFSVFVFHRAIFTPSVAKLIDRIKSCGKEIIFETDDLVYDPAYLVHMDYYQVMNPLERKLYEHGVGGEILADPYVKTCTTTTSFLADKLREKGKRVFIVPNRLSEEDARIADEIRRKREMEEGERNKTVISYFSGSASHNKDFATITGPLFTILGKYPDVELAIYGPLDLDSRFDAFRERIRRAHYVPREKHWENIARTDINLAPLEVGNPFCESKSELKFFEAGIIGVPTVASATRTFREAIEDGVDGFVATTEEEWTGKLERLILDSGLRKRMGERAREKSLEKYVTTSAKNGEYYSHIRSKIGKTI